MNQLLIFQTETPQSPIWTPVLYVVFVVIVISFVTLLRRVKRAPTQTAEYNIKSGIIASIICIVWGGGIWLIMLATQRFDNLLAIIAASFLLCTGLYSLFMVLKKRGEGSG